MGLLALEGSWVDVVAADRKHIIVTRVAGTGDIDAGVYTDELKAMMDVMENPCRLVERSANEGDLVVGTTSNFTFDGESKTFGNFEPTAPPGADAQRNLVLQVRDGVVQGLGMKGDRGIRDKLLHHGLGDFDVTTMHALLTNDELKLLGKNFPKLRAALVAIKGDRNKLLAHNVACVTNAQYKKAMDNIGSFLMACVDTYSLFDATWKRYLEDAVVHASRAHWTVNDLDIVCRIPQDFIRRSRQEAKRLFPAQVMLLPACFATHTSPIQPGTAFAVLVAPFDFIYHTTR
jgi:hypothetical protein